MNIQSHFTEMPYRDLRPYFSSSAPPTVLGVQRTAPVDPAATFDERPKPGAWLFEMGHIPQSSGPSATRLRVDVIRSCRGADYKRIDVRVCIGLNSGQLLHLTKEPL